MGRGDKSLLHGPGSELCPGGKKRGKQSAQIVERMGKKQQKRPYRTPTNNQRKQQETADKKHGSTKDAPTFTWV